MRREWYRVQVRAEEPSTAEIHLIDYIGDWTDQMLNEWLGTKSPVTAKAFVEELAALPESVTALRVHINSPGGDAFAALTIANALRDQRATQGRTVEVVVDGLAASAASIVAMAGAPLRMADNALLMIHNPWTVALGDAAEMRKAAELLDSLRDSLVKTYQWHTPLEAEEVVALLDAETWMDATEAMERGFADEVVEGLPAAAALDPRGVAKLKVPERFAARVAALLKPAEGAPAEPPPPGAPADVLQACADAGLSLGFAQQLLAENLPAAEALERARAERRRLDAEATAAAERQAAAQAREGEIRALCSARGQVDLADEIVASGMSVEGARAHLAKISAKLDAVEIESGLTPDHGSRPKAVIDHVAIYAERNRLRAN